MTPGADPAALLLESLRRIVILDYEYENENDYENENENESGRRGPRGLSCTW